MDHINTWIAVLRIILAYLFIYSTSTYVLSTEKNKLICAENTKFKKLRQKFKQIEYLKIVVVLQNKTTVAVLENM